jgi:hypothetical protein
MRGTLKERFEAKVIAASSPNGCMLWSASVRTHGLPYGMIGVWYGDKCKIRNAHRVSWELYRGPIPKGMKVLHECDNPRCVNPDHLFLGTQLENVHDMHQKGRGPNFKGEKNPRARLSKSQIIEIRNDPRTHVKIAANYGIGTTQVSRIKRGEQWSTA